MAGKARYLDSRPDEQLRGITMESSAISLYFSMSRKDTSTKEYLINLIDSPGHIDFSSEVSTASRLCDGAVVLVDAVEGVCSQTITVLRHTWTEHLKPLLVINKLDRLVTELKMSTSEAYSHLSKLLEQINAVMGSFFQGERMEEDLKWRERMEERISEKNREKNNRQAADPTAIKTEEFEEKDDEDIYFAPEKNNVVFSSAIDGWAFTVKQFAALYEKKLGINKAIMEKVLWGDFYLDPKTRKVLKLKHLKGRSLKPMFVQLVLDPLWSVYEATILSPGGKGDSVKVEKITKSLSITLPAQVLRSKDQRTSLTAILTSWIPLSVAILVSVIEYLPSPPTSQADRLARILDSSPGSSHIDQNLRAAMTEFKTERSEPVVAYVSKMVAMKSSELPAIRIEKNKESPEEARERVRAKRDEIARILANENGENGELHVQPVADSLNDVDLSKIPPDQIDGDSEDSEQLIGFARIFSGTLKVGDQVYVLPPKFSPANLRTSPQPRKSVVTALYLLMGRGLEKLESVPAGVVFGVAGLGDSLLKSGTICTQLEGSVNLAGLSIGNQPIVRVAVEPVNPGDLENMIAGCKLLEQSDPCAEYEVLDNGEHVISTAGELHLERCLKDLRERFARCEIQAGEPIVPYQETIVRTVDTIQTNGQGLPRGTVRNITSSGQLSLRIRVVPLPEAVTEYLQKHAAAIRRFYSERKAEEDGKRLGADTPDESLVRNLDLLDGADDQGQSLQEFKAGLKLAFSTEKSDSDEWGDAVEQIAAFGPRRIGPNALIDATRSETCNRFLRELRTPSERTAASDQRSELSAKDFSDKISHAFQLATAQGPLCLESVQGVAVFLEEISLASSTDKEMTGRNDLGRMTGEVIKTVRDSFKQGFLDWSPRILLAMYSCEIQASAEVLGKVYAVITRRKGRILSESLKEGTPFFTILSVLPVAESFGFSDEIRKRTSGAASPQLIFQGFEKLNEDPFWVPSTEEDLEDLGELADRENVAKKYMDRVRKRKGLQVKGEKLVRDAEKQKTLKR
ncbi:MAG: Cytoplasmic GTPase/eEF2-like protein (ribosomal biogenesis) [Vezdaea aestivalis]|nr:MAG: Cytoplasmic GTPase/eEF2-like protein (ribosomal biogenesis) [Vezdaea aestivalis]